MLRIFTGSAAGGGGGAGTVTSVGTSSNSLVNNSAPNPIIGAGNVSFEVQIIDVTYVQAALLETGNALLEGVIYRITDFNHNIGNVTLTVAQFMTIIDKLNNKKLSTNGIAFSTGNTQYEISYDLQSDFLMMVYCPTYNQRASRFLGSAANCIEQIDWENTNWQNIEVVETDFVGSVEGTIFTNSRAYHSTINWGGFLSIIDGCSFYDASVLLFTDTTSFRNCTVLEAAQVSIGDSARGGIIRETASLSTIAGFPMQNFDIGVGLIVVSNNAITQTDTTTDFFSNELVQLFTAVAIAEQIQSSLCTNINVNIDPSAFAVGYSINLPQFPYHRQIVNIGWNAACATGTGIVTATFAGGGVVVPLFASQKGQCISYQYDAGTATWYLI